MKNTYTIILDDKKLESIKKQAKACFFKLSICQFLMMALIRKFFSIKTNRLSHIKTNFFKCIDSF